MSAMMLGLRKLRRLNKDIAVLGEDIIPIIFLGNNISSKYGWLFTMSTNNSRIKFFRSLKKKNEDVSSSQCSRYPHISKEVFLVVHMSGRARLRNVQKCKPLVQSLQDTVLLNMQICALLVLVVLGDKSSLLQQFHPYAKTF